MGMRYYTLMVSFCLAVSAAAANTFEIVALPDTQYYSKIRNPNLFNTQTQWIADNKNAENIVFVTQLGDITDDGSNPTYWVNASNAMNTISDVAPYSVAFGNHDMHWDYSGNGVSNCTANFGPSRFEGKTWYGGAGGTSMLASYQTFTAGGIDFLHLNLPFSPDAATLTWANGVLTAPANVGKPTIVSTHDYLQINGTRDTVGNSIWNGLVKNNSQVFMVLNGHYHGENQLISRNAAGKNVLQMVADYQDDPNGGNGWLRKIIFDPTAGQIRVQTYSPSLGQFQTDANSQLTYTASFASNAITVGSLITPAQGGVLFYGNYSENFDGMGPAGVTLPSGWKVRNLAGNKSSYTSPNQITPAVVAGATTTSSQTLTAWNYNASSPNLTTFATAANVGGASGDTNRALGANPTNIGGTVLELTLTNATNNAIASAVLSYDMRVFNAIPAISEEIPGYKVFFSTTGGTSAAEWQALPELTLTQTVTGSYTASMVVTPSAPIPFGGSLYLRWVDDNDSTNSPDITYAIDNVHVMTVPEPSTGAALASLMVIVVMSGLFTHLRRLF